MRVGEAMNPAGSYDEGIERIRAIQERDGPRILSAARSALYGHGTRTPLAALLLHGFTNNPAQFAQFAPLLYERGINVFAPRMPEHGDRDRMTTRLERLRAEDLLETAHAAFDAVCGLGERAVVLGMSLGAVLAAHLVQHRPKVARAIGVAPSFAVLDLPFSLSAAAGIALRVLPNQFVWWDRRLKEAAPPPSAYPRYPSRALAQTMRIAAHVYAESARAPMQGGGAVLIHNAQDPAVNGTATREVVARWNRSQNGCASYIAWNDLGRNHEIIDPQHPKARIDLVYPRLLDLVISEDPSQ